MASTRFCFSGSIIGKFVGCLASSPAHSYYRQKRQVFEAKRGGYGRSARQNWKINHEENKHWTSASGVGGIFFWPGLKQFDLAPAAGYLASGVAAIENRFGAVHNLLVIVECMVGEDNDQINLTEQRGGEFLGFVEAIL